MYRLIGGISRSLPVLFITIFSQIVGIAQISDGGLTRENSVFVFVNSESAAGGGSFYQQKNRIAKRRRLVVAKKTTPPPSNSGGPKTGSRYVPEPIAPPEWINEDAEYAIEERKLADAEPMLTLTEGFLNSRIIGCSAPVFPEAARRAKLKSVRLRLSITVAKYGGLLDAQVIEGDAIFRKAVYDSLGSMRFQQTFFMGEPVRIQAMVEFTQHNSDSYNLISCRDAVKEVELPAIIDGDVINNKVKSCEAPQFPAGEKSKGLKSVEAVVEVIVDETGKVSNAKFLNGNAAFGDLAVTAARKAVFPRSKVTDKFVKVKAIMEFKQVPDNGIQCSGAAN